jgi:hypothetical protein
MDIMLLDHVAKSASLGWQMPSLESASLDSRMDMYQLPRQSEVCPRRLGLALGAITCWRGSLTVNPVRDADDIE